MYTKYLIYLADNKLFCVLYLQLHKKKKKDLLLEYDFYNFSTFVQLIKKKKWKKNMHKNKMYWYTPEKKKDLHEGQITIIDY